MSRRSCRAVRKRFLAWEEGALGADEVTELRAHLAACGRCRQAWEGWRRDDAALRGALRPVEAPRDFASAVVAQLRGGVARAAPARRRVALRWAVAAAAAGVVLAAGMWALFGRRYEKIGEVALVEGRVLARQRGSRRLRPLAPGATIYNGDELVTRAASRLGVMLYDRSRLLFEESTGVRLHGGAGAEEPGCGYTLPHVCLKSGEVECDLESLRYFRAVGTPLGAAIVHGTRFRMKYVPGERVLLEVLEGEVMFSSPGGQIVVKPGSIWEIRGSDGVPQRSLTQKWE